MIYFRALVLTRQSGCMIFKMGIALSVYSRGQYLNERAIRKFEEGLNSKVKLLLYKTFNKVVEFKKYLHG
ncbi:hypothetical protein GBAR_LOCUS22336 [Geodia barretti]|uniref:Uncharacterized protein n=1 Tax=Geodia barretti TaxID=519541 RepID=A0AA35T2S5_GEOBA|nr:hypothetical protein GBAR_LOCUS22336 [Geodia barretti]